MNRIEELITKFIPLKNMLETKGINELTNEGNTSILSLLKNPNVNNSLTHLQKEKKIINRQSISNNYHENNPNLKTKDKNKFFTKKYPDQNIPINGNKQKEFSPLNNSQYNHTNVTISAFNQNAIKYGQKNINKNSSKNNNANDITNTNNASTPAELNLLVIENKEVSQKDAKKIFEIERSEEMYKKNMAEKDSKNQHNMLGDDSDEDFDFLDDENENLEKKKKTNKNEQIISNNLPLNLCKGESLIDLNQPFNIFDKSKLMGVEDDFLNCDANDEENNRNEPMNKNNDNLEEPKKVINKPKKNEIKKNNKNFLEEEPKNDINEIKKNEVKKNRNKLKEIDKKNYKEDIKEKNSNNNNIIDEEDNNNSSEILTTQNHVIRIEIGEDDEILNGINEEKNKNNEYQSLNNDNIKNKNVDINKNKKKKENHLNPIKKNNIKSKSCLNPNINGVDSKNNSKINKNKVIIDDEDEENYDSNNKNSQNELFLSPEKNVEEKKDSLILNKGSKITVIFGNDNSSKKIPLSKMNKDKIRSNSTSNNNENYDLLCINTINKVLTQIENKLKQENSKNKINERSFEIIKRIKDNKTELLRRKKNTFLGILKILENIFSLLCDIKTFKINNNNNEIFQILACIQEYYKNIKKYDKDIIDNTYYYNKQIAFKYVYSSLEIKNYDNYTLKELTKKDNNEENLNNLLKLAKAYKRYKKTSEYLYKEVKEFKEKMNNTLYKTKYNITFQQKYESCLTNIQTSPHFMKYMNLFNHYIIILNFFTDYRTFKDELEKQKKNKIIDTKREKSVQIKRNGSDFNTKNRERSRYKEREKEKEIEKDKDKDKDKEKIK